MLQQHWPLAGLVVVTEATTATTRETVPPTEVAPVTAAVTAASTD